MVSLIITLVCAPMCFTSWYSGKMLLWLGFGLGCIWLIGHVPALLILTVNHQKKVKQQQPPQGLQFHGDNLDPLELEQDEFNGPQSNQGEYCWRQL